MKFRKIYIFYGVVSLFILYTVILFISLKLYGVYGVAIIKESVATTEGVVYTYEFLYEGFAYSGEFTGIGKQKVGERYFVSFLKSNPNRSLLQYNHPVPGCLADSFNVFWNNYPDCP